MSDMLTMPQVMDALCVPGHLLTAICDEPPGGTFRERMCPVGALPDQVPQDRNVWFSINPIDPSIARRTVWGVAALVAVWADLDVKPGGFADEAAAQAWIDTMSTMLGTRPTLVIHSGHGLQPVWSVGEWANDHSDVYVLDTQERRTDAQVLLARWKRLCRTVADAHGAQLDSVFDLPRLLRWPGSLNLKYPDWPVAAYAVADVGHELGVNDLDEALNAYGAHELPEDRLPVSGTNVTPPEQWEFQDEGCEYARRALQGWATDTAPMGRHPWLVAQATRIHAMHRYGCLSEALWGTMRTALNTRFEALLSVEPVRTPAVGEFDSAWEWAGRLVATKTDLQVASEVGSHLHISDRLSAGAMADMVQCHDPGLLHPPTREIESPLGVTKPPSAPPVDGGLAMPTNRAAVHEGLGRKCRHTWVVATPEGPVRFADVPMSDEGNAIMVTEVMRPAWRWAHESKQWLRWTGAHWERVPEELAHNTVRNLWRSVDLSADDTPAAVQKYLLASQSEGKVRSAARMTAGAPGVIISEADLDSHPWLLATPEGTVDLRTGETEPPNPDLLITQTTSVTPAAAYEAALAPRWEDFLRQTFGGDQALTAFVQQCLGMALIGKPLLNALPFLHGAGANGKSVLLQVVSELMGDYAAPAPPGLLTGKGESFGLAGLAGKRLVFTTEVPALSAFTDDRLKSLTGGDKLMVRHMYGRYFQMQPSFTLVIAGNNLPAVKDDSDGVWRRVKLVPFRHVVPEADRDPEMASMLISSEGPHILAWLIEGARSVITLGRLIEPDSIRQATADYRSEEDRLGTYLREALVHEPGSGRRLPIAEVFRAWDVWRCVNGGEEVSPVVMGRRIAGIFGVRSAHSNVMRYYPDMRLASGF